MSFHINFPLLYSRYFVDRSLQSGHGRGLVTHTTIHTLPTHIPKPDRQGDCNLITQAQTASPFHFLSYMPVQHLVAGASSKSHRMPFHGLPDLPNHPSQAHSNKGAASSLPVSHTTHSANHTPSRTTPPPLVASSRPSQLTFWTEMSAAAAGCSWPHVNPMMLMMAKRAARQTLLDAATMPVGRPVEHDARASGGQTRG